MNKDRLDSSEKVKEWEAIRTTPGRTKAFQGFMDSLEEKSVRKAKVKFGKEWGEEK